MQRGQGQVLVGSGAITSESSRERVLSKNPEYCQHLRQEAEQFDCDEEGKAKKEASVNSKGARL